MPRKVRQLALLVMLTGLHISAQAQAYRCTVDGKVVFQQQPCIGGQKLSRVPDPPDPNSYEGRVALAVPKQQVFIGMKREDVIRSWGPPDKNNKSIREGSTSEQWVCAAPGDS